MTFYLKNKKNDKIIAESETKGELRKQKKASKNAESLTISKFKKSEDKPEPFAGKSKKASKKKASKKKEA